MSGLGITAGAHRLWSHRSYKAKLPLRILLLIFHTMTFQYSLINWARDHRVHHKYSDTDADPHNIRRYMNIALHSFSRIIIGKIHFCFTEDSFSHMSDGYCARGIQKISWKALKWICLTLKVIHCYASSTSKYIRLPRKCTFVGGTPLGLMHVLLCSYYYLLMPIAFCMVPILIPMAFWNETLANAWFIAVVLRYAIVLHITFSVNSFAHLYGDQPYDRWDKVLQVIDFSAVNIWKTPGKVFYLKLEDQIQYWKCLKQSPRKIDHL